MPKLSINYSSLEKSMKKTYKLSEVKDKIEKVAFDVVRFKDGDLDKLWQIQSADDGEYIVALYDTSVEEPTKKAASLQNKWEVLISEAAGELNIFYGNDPVIRFGYKELGIPREELFKVKRYLPGKLASNKDLVKLLFKDMTVEAKKNILTKYPELAQQVE